MVVTVVEAPACHLCEDAKAALAVLAGSYPLRINVVSMTEQAGLALMQEHRAPMSPLVLLTGRSSASGRLSRRSSCSRSGWPRRRGRLAVPLQSGRLIRAATR